MTCNLSTFCSRSSDPFHLVAYYIKWVTNSRTHSSKLTVHVFHALEPGLGDIDGHGGDGGHQTGDHGRHKVTTNAVLNIYFHLGLFVLKSAVFLRGGGAGEWRCKIAIRKTCYLLQKHARYLMKKISALKVNY